MDGFKEEIREAVLKIVKGLMITVIFLILLSAFTGCNTTRTVTKEVPVEVPIVRHDTVVIRQAAKELVRIKDSIVKVKDTMMFYHTTYIDRSKHDTVYLSKTDTVTRPLIVKQTEVKEKKTNSKVKIIALISTILLLIAIFLMVKKRLLPTIRN